MVEVVGYDATNATFTCNWDSILFSINLEKFLVMHLSKVEKEELKPSNQNCNSKVCHMKYLYIKINTIICYFSYITNNTTRDNSIEKSFNFNKDFQHTNAEPSNNRGTINNSGGAGGAIIHPDQSTVGMQYQFCVIHCSTQNESHYFE